MDVIERIREECYRREIPISRLEKDCGFSNGYIRSLKRGTMPITKLQKVADYFGVSVTYLMVGEDVRATIEGDFADMLRMSSTDRIIEGNNDLKLLFETVKDAPTDVLVRLRYYAEGLLAARKDSV